MHFTENFIHIWDIVLHVSNTVLWSNLCSILAPPGPSLPSMFLSSVLCLSLCLWLLCVHGCRTMYCCQGGLSGVYPWSEWILLSQQLLVSSRFPSRGGIHEPLPCLCWDSGWLDLMQTQYWGSRMQWPHHPQQIVAMPISTTYILLLQSLHPHLPQSSLSLGYRACGNPFVCYFNFE